MSSFNTPEFINNRGENYFYTSSVGKVGESRKLSSPRQFQDTTKCTMSYEQQKHAFHCHEIEKICGRPVLNKRYKRSLDNDIYSAKLLNYIQNNTNQFDCKPYNSSVIGSAFKFPYSNCKINSYKEHPEQNLDSATVNNTKSFSNSVAALDLSNPHLNRTANNSNGRHVHKTKTANSFGSSCFVNSQLRPFNILSSKSMYSQDKNVSHSQIKYMKSHSVPYPPNLSNLNGQNNDPNYTDSNAIPNPVNFISNEPIMFSDLNNHCYRNNNNRVINHAVKRKESIPECHEPDMRSSTIDSSFDHLTMKSPAEIYAVNCSPHQNQDEMSNIPVTKARNSIPFLNSSVPIYLFNKGIASENRGINTCPQFYFPYPNNNIMGNNVIHTDQTNKYVQNVDVSDTFLQPKQDLTNGAQYFYSSAINDIQPPSSNDEIKNHSEPTIVAEDINHVIEQVISLVDVPNNETNHEIDVKTVGKFTVTLSRDTDCSGINLKRNVSTEDACNPSVQIEKARTNEVPNKTSNTGNQQPRSRFKKTRIKEIVERWHINGMSTYDCRFKVIPAKIMELQGKTLDHMSDDYQHNLCQNCEDHDSGYRCHTSQYYNKEFLFWDNGERISICGKSEFNTEIYCLFHSKYLNLLNQNQCLSLSQFVPQYVNAPSTTVLSYPQTIHEICITEPENQYHTMYIDVHNPQNDPFSAPPASPSIMTSTTIPSLAYDVYSPQGDTDVVVLRCHTPILHSSPSRHISFERLFHRPSSRMSIESDSTSMVVQPIFVADSNSLVEMFQNSPTKNLAPSMPSQSCINTADIVDEGFTKDTICQGQHSMYSLAQMPHMFSSIPQQIMPSLAKGINNNQAIDHLAKLSNPEDRLLSSSNAMHEIDDSLTSLKSMIHNLVVSEQQPLINEIRVLAGVNSNLRKELSLAKKRSEYLESMLKEHNVPVDIYITHENMSMPNLSTTTAGDCRDEDGEDSDYRDS